MIEKINDWEQDFVVCDYAKKLVDKLVYLNGAAREQLVDVEAVKKAIYYAKRYHADQKRQSGEPFYSHPLEVAYMLSDYMFRTDVIITAILHDTVEDTELTQEKIAQEFGTKIANQVMDLTRIKGDGTKISSAKMVALLYMEKKHAVLLIKLFDRLHNIQTISAKSPEKVKKIIEETLQHFIFLAEYLGLPNISKMIETCSNIHATEDDNLSIVKYFDREYYQLLSLIYKNASHHKHS